jgi:hypothetical protein
MLPPVLAEAVLIAELLWGSVVISAKMRLIRKQNRIDS